MTQCAGPKLRPGLGTRLQHAEDRRVAQDQGPPQLQALLQHGAKPICRERTHTRGAAQRSLLRARSQPPQPLPQSTMTPLRLPALQATLKVLLFKNFFSFDSIHPLPRQPQSCTVLFVQTQSYELHFAHVRRESRTADEQRGSFCLGNPN